MLRIRLKTPRGRDIEYTNVDVIKDAATNMLVAAGGNRTRLGGEGSLLWGAAAICTRYTTPRNGKDPARRIAHEIVISTPDPEVATLLEHSNPDNMRKFQPVTGESIDMSGATMTMEMDPVIPDLTTSLDAYALTPMLASRVDGRQLGRWHSSVRDFDLSATVSARLSRIAGRTVNLTVVPDELYLAGRGTYATRVDIRTKDKKPVVVVGMTFPFMISGPWEDLRLAWYAGIGERTRLGFGFFAAA
jgi:CRISPR-associated endoribonuclease Cas6